jgi:hypothetical protein
MMNTSGNSFKDHIDSMVSQALLPLNPSLRLLSDPFIQRVNRTTRSHPSQELCLAALQFASDTLKPGGHFVCKFYVGQYYQKVEDQLEKLFKTVMRIKPEASRKASRPNSPRTRGSIGFITLTFGRNLAKHTGWHEIGEKT